MNLTKESEYALRNKCCSIKKIIKIVNIKYLLLPLIYIFVILISIPNMEVYNSEYKYERLDTYRTIIIYLETSLTSCVR